MIIELVGGSWDGFEFDFPDDLPELVEVCDDIGRPVGKYRQMNQSTKYKYEGKPCGPES